MDVVSLLCGKVGEVGMSDTYYFEIDENGEYHKVEPPKVNKNIVPVVRCQDCEHGIEGTWNYKENKMVHIRCEYRGEFHSPDWYCADGVKRE